MNLYSRAERLARIDIEESNERIELGSLDGFNMGDLVTMTFGSRKTGSIEGMNYSDHTVTVWFADTQTTMDIHTKGLI